MRRNILLVQFVGVLLLLPSIMSGQQHSSDNKNWAEKGIVIREVEILGKRPMKDIGVQQTRFDSLVLKENIALSMADILTFNSSIFCKKLRTCHAFYCIISGNVCFAYTGNMERYAYQQSNVGDD